MWDIVFKHFVDCQSSGRVDIANLASVCFTEETIDFLEVLTAPLFPIISFFSLTSCLFFNVETSSHKRTVVVTYWTLPSCSYWLASGEEYLHPSAWLGILMLRLVYVDFCFTPLVPSWGGGLEMACPLQIPQSQLGAKSVFVFPVVVPGCPSL